MDAVTGPSAISERSSSRPRRGSTPTASGSVSATGCAQGSKETWRRRNGCQASRPGTPMRAAGATRWVVGAARPAPSRRSSLPGRPGSSHRRVEPSSSSVRTTASSGAGSRAGRKATTPAPPTLTTTSEGGSGEGPATTSSSSTNTASPSAGGLGAPASAGSVRQPRASSERSRTGRTSSIHATASTPAPVAVASARATRTPGSPGGTGRSSSRSQAGRARVRSRRCTVVASSPGTSAPPASTTPAGVTTSCPPTRWTRRRTTCPRQRPVPVPVDGDRPRVAQHPPGAFAAVQHEPVAVDDHARRDPVGRAPGRCRVQPRDRRGAGQPGDPPQPQTWRVARVVADRRDQDGTGADGGQREGGAVGGRVHVGKVVVSEAAEVEVHGGPSRRGLAGPPPGEGAPERRTFETHQRRPRREPDDGDVRQHRAPTGAGGHRAPRPVGGAAMPEIRPGRAREPQCDPGASPLQPGGGPHVHAVPVAMTRSGRQQQRALVAGRRHVREHGRRHVVGRLQGVGAQVPLLTVRRACEESANRSAGAGPTGAKANGSPGAATSAGPTSRTPSTNTLSVSAASRPSASCARPVGREHAVAERLEGGGRGRLVGRGQPGQLVGGLDREATDQRQVTAPRVERVATELDRRVGAMGHHQRVGELERVQLGGHQAVGPDDHPVGAGPAEQVDGSRRGGVLAGVHGADPAQRLLDVLVVPPHELGSGVGVTRRPDAAGPPGQRVGQA